MECSMLDPGYSVFDASNSSFISIYCSLAWWSKWYLRQKHFCFAVHQMKFLSTTKIIICYLRVPVFAMILLGSATKLDRMSPPRWASASYFPMNSLQSSCWQPVRMRNLLAAIGATVAMYYIYSFRRACLNSCAPFFRHRCDVTAMSGFHLSDNGRNARF